MTSRLVIMFQKQEGVISILQADDPSGYKVSIRLVIYLSLATLHKRRPQLG
jgi:hypothetical protein